MFICRIYQGCPTFIKEDQIWWRCLWASRTFWIFLS